MKINKINIAALALALALVLVLPQVSFAALPTTTTAAPNVCNSSMIEEGLSGLLNYISCTLIKNVVPVILAVAMVAFIWGVIQMYINPNNEEARKKGKSYIIWGLVGLTVIISVWALVSIISETFGIHVFIPQLSNI